jgi:uncharacterized protein
MTNTILIYTRTAGYRHDSIPAGISALSSLADREGLAAEATEDPAAFEPKRLASCAAVVFLSTTGTVLTDPARAALEDYVMDGGGFLGVHSASATEEVWPFYGDLVGARFAGHPALQTAAVTVSDRDHPATAGLPEQWPWTDEWYDFTAFPAEDSRVLATVDEALYEGGLMGPGHPLVWCREMGLGRSFYTALGHRPEAYADPAFRAHLAGALRWTADRG